ncbi:hypothetical protein QUC31_011841 [Theobroma cacao]
MALAKRGVMFFMMIMVALRGLSMAAVYKVGDSAGWTILGNGQDYHDWAATNKFFVGDTLFFEYNTQFHNVKQVNVEDFKSCNPDNPIATYVDGSDNITLKSSGEYYFLCGFPGHCQAGMKLHITVNSAANSPQNPTPNPLASNVAPSLHASKLSCLVMVVAAATLPFFLQLV